MSNEEDIKLFNEIENLLKKEIELARRGSYAKVMELACECETLVARTAQAGLREKQENKTTIDHLAGLYNELQLLLSTQRTAVAEQLRTISKGKKTLAMYREGV
jgi:hypothetical protein